MTFSFLHLREPFGAAVVRPAVFSDVSELHDVMTSAIEHLQSPYLSEREILASKAVMGLDTQLIEDGTYFVVECRAGLLGGGGWSGRATLYGGDHSSNLRDARLLDPCSEAARVRAMFTRPSAARNGVGGALLRICEAAAREAGFRRIELMATLAGEPFYVAYGYSEIERIRTKIAGVDLPLVLMGKAF